MPTRISPAFGKLKKIISDECGAITVDWIVLAAMAVGLAALASSTISDGVLGLTDSLVTYMSSWNFN